MHGMAIGMMVVVMFASPATALAQTAVPVPRPFPGAPAPPTSSAPRPATPAQIEPASPGQTPAPEMASVGPQLPGVPPVYPTSEYLDAIDAGSGQHYYLYGVDVPFADIVAYYRTVMKNGGREIYRTPGVHQFDLGRFNDARMAYPPSVVVKDYAGGSTPGYLHVAGTTEKRFRTIIQIVPPGVE